ncbi:FUSC family protein [Dubosiella muris]|uniref:FUSC family protein n=1 Tax=Dubosiella muris TaxID=3038133 RepID=A0AC61R6L1_9FIRM|nr:FUSC family protein [Dubosiella muris]TGY65732.1 FUSC family protein [Dubosiella muris]
MKFYDILQCSPDVLKRMIRSSDDPQEIKRLRRGMIVRSLLIVVFAIAFIGVMAALFGSDNSAMAVSIFCILLAVRFVNYGYCLRDSILNMAIVFALLLVAPVASYAVDPVLKFLMDGLSLFVILMMTSDDPKMGNGGLYSFAFIFLTGNPVEGQAFVNRAWMTLIGFVLCALVYAHNHKDQNANVTFWSKIRRFSLYEYKDQWRIRLAVGVGLLLAVFSSIHLERFMWAGFACGSLLSDVDVEARIREKFSDRLLGVVLGSAAFYVVYTILPASLYPLVGPVGGLCLGLCTEYKHKTALNCFGALMLAAGMYGVEAAVWIRIADTLIGIVFALAFFYVYDRFVLHRFLPHRSHYGARKEEKK